MFLFTKRHTRGRYKYQLLDDIDKRSEAICKYVQEKAIRMIGGLRTCNMRCLSQIIINKCKVEISLRIKR